MSDYGFATYDENGKKLEGVVNSKWPIFGPKYNDIKKAFRTIHFTDTKQYSYRTASLPTPSGDYSISEYHGYEKILIATIPHGYKKRPMGYCTISGTFTKNVRGRWEYTRVNQSGVSYWPASTTLTSVATSSGAMQSVPGSGVMSLVDNQITGPFCANLFDECGMTYPNDLDGNPMNWYWVGDGYFYIPGNNSSTGDVGGEVRVPYAVEIDDTNVYVYRYYYWCDVWKRQYANDSYIKYDVRGRFKGIIDYAGSSFDLTIYLCPYSFGDLI